MLELVRSVRRFAQQFAYDLPGQQFVERVAAAREVPKLIHVYTTQQETVQPCMRRMEGMSHLEAICRSTH